MRRLWIFLYFLVLTTLSLHVGQVFATLVTISIFMIFYNLAEQLDIEENNDLVASINNRKEEC